MEISIHAPPRGATDNIANLLTVKIFQFTPLREGRPACKKIHFAPSYFNSRPSARGDDSRTYEVKPELISIHAPPRGATFFVRGYAPHD